MNYKEKVNIFRSKLSHDIEEKILFDILFEMGRSFDSEYIKLCHDKKLALNESEKKQLRKYYYYGTEKYLVNGLADFDTYKANASDKHRIIDDFLNRCEQYDENKIIKSVEERFKDIKSKKNTNFSKDWLDYYDKKRKSNSSFSLFIFDYDQNKFITDNYDISNIYKIIADMYDSLENYRYFIFNLNGKLYNSTNEDVTWKTIYKIGIYCENFVQYNLNYRPFKKDKQVKILNEFLYDRLKLENTQSISDDFYSNISTGLKFEDCLISESQEHIILSYQKIKVDETPVPCPICMSTLQRGNSYPQMFLRSYECQNPKCKERSKSGRGKRFNEFATYRYFKLVQNQTSNHIEDDLYNQWRKDIFSDNNDIYKMLLKYYAWDKEYVCMTNPVTNSYNRVIKKYKYKGNNKYIKKYEDLAIVRLFKSIASVLPEKTGNKIITNNIVAINGNSTTGVQALKNGQIGVAITSPPYYNAREYSQWSNLLLYLIDMQSNCTSIYKTLIDDGYYFYNIGDIVNRDNIYVNSNMSNRRLQLGFYSSMIFEICGFNLVGNIIWNKGEVQSKRNSTPNHTTGYIKCINCYEHILVFKKGRENNIISEVRHITPVIKINSKGENTAGHTAPYPLELVDIIRPYIYDSLYVLDPFLGSGTTLKWCKNAGVKGIGFELNPEYYKLAVRNIGLQR